MYICCKLAQFISKDIILLKQDTNGLLDNRNIAALRRRIRYCVDRYLEKSHGNVTLP